MAHFESAKEAGRFAAAFGGYLVPGVLDGPELAEEVAKLEGLPGAWTELEARAWNKADPPPLIRERAAWHPHQPDVEQEPITDVNISDWETEPDLDR